MEGAIASRPLTLYQRHNLGSFIVLCRKVSQSRLEATHDWHIDIFSVNSGEMFGGFTPVVEDDSKERQFIRLGWGFAKHSQGVTGLKQYASSRAVTERFVLVSAEKNLEKCNFGGKGSI